MEILMPTPGTHQATTSSYVRSLVNTFFSIRNSGTSRNFNGYRQGKTSKVCSYETAGSETHPRH